MGQLRFPVPSHQTLPLLPEAGELRPPLLLGGGQGTQAGFGPGDEERALGVFVAQGLAAQSFPLEGGPALLHLLQPLRQSLLELREPRLLQRLLRARPLPFGPKEAFLLLQPPALLVQDIVNG